MESNLFDIVLSEEAKAFLDALPEKTRDKIYCNIHRVQKGELSNTLFKKLKGTEIWEFRTKYNKIAYRLLSFWDTDKNVLVIVTHGFVKKSQATPGKEIKRAETYRNNYIIKQKRLWKK